MWTYFWIARMLECPRMDAKVAKSIPRSAILLANVCRKS